MALEAEGVSVDVLGKPVLREVDFMVDDRDFIAVMGHNGAGKTTLLRAILGLWHVRQGRIAFDGDDITNAPTHRIVARGISMVPQLRGYFENLTVEENLAFVPHGDGRIGEREVFELFPPLADRRHQMVGTMSGGERQMVALALALLANPKLMLLDEPSVGLAPAILDSVMRVVSTANEEFGIAIVLVEQNVRKACELARRAYVLNQGRVAWTGAAEQALERNLWELV